MLKAGLEERVAFDMLDDLDVEMQSFRITEWSFGVGRKQKQRHFGYSRNTGLGNS